MSPTEIDRLHIYRETGSFVNTSEEFQSVTQISDSLLEAIAPYFKFPKWKSEKFTKATSEKRSEEIIRPEISGFRTDLNKATADDLIRINGVGLVLSKRILKFRQALGGFHTDEQLHDVYGLEMEVVARIQKEFTVISLPEIQPVSLGKASAEELSRLVYISYELAREIIHYRDSVGEIKTLDELTKIQGFPTDRFNRIKLYLTL